MVLPMACHVVLSPRSSKKRLKTGGGDGRTYSGRQPLHTTTCQTPTTMAMASSFGQVPAHRRAEGGRRVAAGAARGGGGAAAPGRRAGAVQARQFGVDAGLGDRPLLQPVLNDGHGGRPPRAS